jgi:hypothetical protein
MSRHIGRKERWTQVSSTEYAAQIGKVVYQKQAWYGLLDYQLRSAEEGPMPVWVPHKQELGPYRRPRNAMIAVEREATMLKNRHGSQVLLKGELWAEA